MAKHTFNFVYKQLINLKVTHYAKVFNYRNHQCSSVHFFNEVGKEVAFFIPDTIELCNYKLNKVNRNNPIDSKNKRPIIEYSNYKYYLENVHNK